MDQYSLEDLISDASFVRWIRGEAIPGEATRWNRWLRKDPSHKQLLSEAKSLLIAFQKEEDEMFGIRGELEKFEQGLGWESRVRNETFIPHPNPKQNRNKTSYHKQILAAVAVIIVAALTGWFAILQNPWMENGSEGYSNLQEYNTDFGEKAIFRLSDNSKIVLNANSQIRFYSGISGGGQNITEVWLQGEAWFDITHFEGERRRTFTVHTNDGSVEVLGTRFAVKTLENETRTVLEKGEIQVTRQSESQTVDAEAQTGSHGTILQPGEMALYSAGKAEVTVEKVNPRVYTSWSEDIWFFEDTPMAEIARRIEDTFGLGVEIGSELIDRKLSGSIKSTDVDVLAEALAKILDAKIRMRDQKLYVEMNK